MSSKSVVFIHGMFMTPQCWDGWVAYFQNRGYECSAPPWPGRDFPVETLRERHPDPQLGKLTLEEVVEHFDQAIRAMPGEPVIIGHSMGGLVTQILVNRGLGSAGVAVTRPHRWGFSQPNGPSCAPTGRC